MSNVITVPTTQYLRQVRREKRTRKDAAWLVHDLTSGTVLISQKLQNVVDYINSHLAKAQRDRVSVAGLYEASDMDSLNRVDGCHKFRYRVMGCPVSKSHERFNQVRATSHVDKAIILTDSPQTYVLGSRPGFTFESAMSIPIPLAKVQS